MLFANHKRTPPGGPSKSPFKPSRAARTLFALACLALACAGANAQDAATRHQEDGAPPPMRYVPEELRAQLSAARDMKARTRLSLELADAQITRAGEHADADRFDEATRALGIYEALIRDAVTFLQKSGPVDNKRRDQYKRIEMTLRAHVPRIETLRRGLPAQNAVYAKATLDYIRGLRTEALNAFYDDTVLRETTPPPPPKPETKPGGRGDDASQQSPAKNEKKP
jgi:hypothetical protein